LYNVISIDLEQWFDRPIYYKYLEEKEIDPNLIVSQINMILNIFKKYDKRTTFFVLGQVAENFPELIKEIYEGGHEIAYHGYSHLPLNSLGENGFKDEIIKGKKIIYNIIKEDPKGFRSPLFSLNKKSVWALKILTENNFIYDSSIFPQYTPLYGSSTAPVSIYRPSFENPFLVDNSQDKIWEFPMLVREYYKLRLPAAGGFYLRLFGSNFIIRAVQAMNKKGYPAICYIHPWELARYPIISLPLHKKIFSYYGIPCIREFEKIVKLIKVRPAIEIIEEL
jgi:polysaccharide deacetylase family protein (PEP-CTERM system associated)